MMNLKYYLRGLGIGVVVTALIMGITAGRTRETLSNEEIKERARALGMVEESQVLADMLAEEEEASSGEENTPEPASDALSASVTDDSAKGAAETEALMPEDSMGGPEGEDASEGPEDLEAAAPEASGETENGTGNESGEGSAAPQEDEAESGTETDVPENADGEAEDTSGGSVTILIESGEGSFIVCQKLEDAGIVPLASEFDRYLYDNGYDKRINIGTYEIPVGASFEEIARIIAKLD